ncbi:Protein of unknown function (DUF1643) [Desulfosporosinus orientis DSM 765]|uniref:DUF1643 domain-containing protein n=1 Tax=Desulfosporosinus orientis (strain ATCC 19365 / DSM 765 / NCIMB 8382 / VKM B-1628 / Singapore I) TaxID=768706 RepID=G7WD83_DESOD|nr:DUF1643 domain-containing protein [Desulfosporosinus orientis]AET67568.1 Protein of unknown function (DUF1643) [Desulfosporosinus orientis DSM 765]
MEKRELLEFKLKKPGDKIALIIMMNPASANSSYSDGTINGLIEFLINDCSVSNEVHQNKLRIINDISNILITNLFSIYNPNSKDLNKSLNKIIQYKSYEFLSKVIESNHKEIDEAISDSQYIIFGWGDCPKDFHTTVFHNQIIKVMQSIISHKKEELFVFHIINNRAKARGVAFDNVLTKAMNPVHPSNGQITDLLRIDIDTIYRILPRVI